MISFDLSEPTKPDIEGKTIDIDKETKQAYQNRIHYTFRERLGQTWRGETDVGKVLGIGLDILETFAPRWISRIRTELQHKKPTKMNWIKNRLKEKSTWRGIVAFLTAIGVGLSPDQAAAIVTTGVALIGVFEAFFKEPQSEDAN